MVEWWYNTNYHEATKITPYEAIYGQQSPFVFSYLLDTSKVNVVDNFLQNQEATFATLKENLEMSQNCMKQQAYKHRSEHSFKEENQVFLHLQHYKYTYLKSKGHQNIEPKFYGPYQII